MKAMKKLSCVLLAVLLLMSLSVTAFAAGSAPTPVTPADEVAFHISINKTAGEHTYKAYQIFTGDLAKDADGKEILSNIEWGNGLTGAGKTALISKYCPDNPKATAAEVAEAISGTSADVLAGEIAALVSENAIALTENGNYYTSEALVAGYYLVLDELTKDAEGAAVSDYVVQVLGDTTMAPKASAPSVEKKVKDVNDSTGAESGWQDSADYDIGDDIPYQITVTLPSTYADYATYQIVITDTLSKGLTFKDDITFAPTLVDGSYVIGTSTNEAGETVVTVTIENLKKAAPDLTSSAEVPGTLTLTYHATLDEDAVAGNPNTVVLQYSNNPNGTGTGHTPEDTVTVFTFEFDVNKVDENEQPLEGAVFQLYKRNTAGEFVAVGEPKEATGEGDVKNEFKFVGLDDGVYMIKETVTPPGYNTIDDIYFKVEATHDDDSVDPKLTDLTVTQTQENGQALPEGTKATFEATPNLAGGTFSSNIVNQSGLELPETGGIGTTIFYAVGGILVAAAIVLLITKKRMTKEG